MNLEGTLVTDVGGAPSITFNNNHSLIETSSVVATLSYTERAAVRLSVRRMAEFLRSVDFMIAAAMYRGVELSLRAFVDRVGVRSKDRSYPAVFQVPILLEAKRGPTSPNAALDRGKNAGESPTVIQSFELRSALSKQDVQDHISAILKEAVALGCVQSSLLQCEEFSLIFQPIANEIEHIAVGDLIFGDTENSLHQLIHNCMEIISEDVELCLSRINKYQFLCDEYEYNSKFLLSMNMDVLKDMSVTQVSKELARFRFELNRREETARYDDVGVVRLDLSPVLERVKQMHEKSEKLLHDLIPGLFNFRSTDLYDYMFGFIAEVSTQPKNVGAFVNAMMTFNKASTEFSALEERYYDVLSLRTLIEEYEITSSKEIAIVSENLQSAFNRYLSVTSSFQENLDDNIEKFKRELKRRSLDLQGPISEVNNRMTLDLLMDPESNTEDVLEELRSIQLLLNSIVLRAQEINTYQDVMKISVFDMDKVKEMSEELISNNNLWEAVQLIKALQREVYQGHFLVVDSKKIELTIKSAEQVSRRIKRENTRLHQWLKKAIADLKAVDPLLRAFQSKSLRGRHIDSIHEILGIEIFRDPDLCVGELVELGLVEYTAQCQAILHQSQCESNIEHVLKELLTKAKGLELRIQDDDRDRSLSTYINIEQVNMEVHDMVVTCSSALASTFVEPHRKEFFHLTRSLTLWLRLLGVLSELQDKYRELHVFFNTSRVARFLHQAVPLFNTVDMIWRAVIKVSKADSKVSFLFERPQLPEKLNEASVLLDQINVHVDVFLHEQQEKWPKLHILSKQSLLTALTNPDPARSFESCRYLFPNISALQFDGHRIPNATSVSSGAEVLLFKTSAFFTGTLVDWFRGIESAMTERLSSDIREIVENKRTVIEDLRAPRCCDQSRVCAVQLKFWSELLRAQGPKEVSNRYRFDDIQDEIALHVKLITKVKTKYQLQATSNILIQMLHHRDILSKYLRTRDVTQQSFLIDSCMKKRWSPSQGGRIFLQMGRQDVPYGLKYYGFEARMAITPLAEKCMVALAMAFQNREVGFVAGSIGAGKRGFISELCFELGCENFSCDCATIREVERMEGYLFAAVGCGLFLSFLHIETLSTEMFSSLINYWTVLNNALLSGMSKIFVGNRRVVVPALAPRITFLMNERINENLGFFPASLRKLFRIIRFNAPPRLAVLNTLLEVYDYPSIRKVSLRIDAFCQDLIDLCEIQESIILRVLVASLRETAEEKMLSNYQESINPCLDLVKSIVKKLAVQIESKIGMDELKFICNVFAEATIDPTVDNHWLFGMLQSTNTIKTALIKSIIESQTVIVVGKGGTGKSTVIKNAIQEMISDRENSGNSESTGKKGEERTRHYRSFKLYKYTLNLPVMANYQSATITESELARRSEDVMKYIMNGMRKDTHSNIVHLDAYSSEYVTMMAAWCEETSKTVLTNMKFIWECCEIAHITPATACSYPIIYVGEDRITVHQVVHKNIEKITSRSVVNFIILIFILVPFTFQLI